MSKRSTADVAAKLGVSVAQIYRWIADGDIRFNGLHRHKGHYEWTPEMIEQVRKVRDRPPEKPPILTASPTLRAIYEEADAQGYNNTTLAKLINRNVNQTSSWRRGAHETTIMTTEEMADALGLEIIVRKKQ
jgi:hypothetical protein